MTSVVGGVGLFAALEALRHPKALRGPFDFAQGRPLKRRSSTVVLAAVGVPSIQIEIKIKIKIKINVKGDGRECPSHTRGTSGAEARFLFFWS